jgi:SET domain-containing protein
MVNFKYETFVAASPIHGMGRFAKHFIASGSIVVEILGNIYRNENQSYVNHSLENNLDFISPNIWKANRDIEIGEELTMNYLQWIKELPF